MTGLPAGLAVRIEFVTGTWTDVTPDVNAKQPITWRIGRTSPFAEPSPASISIELDNTLGRYTPQRQVLADGVTPNPYWPNVDVRKRIQISYLISGTRYVRFLGYIKQWLPGFDGFAPICTVSATDWLDQASRVALPQPLLTELLADAPAALYAMREAAGNTAVADSAGTGRPLNILGQPMALGAPTPTTLPDGLTGLQITYTPNTFPVATTSIGLPGNTCRTLEAWVTIIGATAVTGITCSIAVYDAAAPNDTAGTPLVFPYIDTGAGTYTLPGGSPTFGQYVSGLESGLSGGGATYELPGYDAQPHHFVVTNTSGTTWTIYVDGVARATFTAALPYIERPALRISSAIIAGGQQVVVGPVAVYTTALTAARVAAHYRASAGGSNETTGARIARLLGYAGLAPADTHIDAGVELLSAQALTDNKLLDVVPPISTTEGGGAVFYVAPDGLVTFTDRQARRPGAPTLTIDAGADADAGTFAPSYDELTLINSATATRDGGTAQTYTDTASVARFGLTSESVSTLSATDQAALNLAQWRVHSQCSPSWRLAAVDVDLLTATTAGLYQTVAAVRVGSRLRIISLDPTAAPRPTLDLYVEGWTETIAIDQYSVVFDTSPADNPAPLIWNDATYGRWQADGNTLTSTITASATTLSITTAAGKARFTTAAGAYPMQIRIGEEVLTLPTVPTGSGAQTFTGVLRGQANTPASAQAAGSAVALYPASTWTL